MGLPRSNLVKSKLSPATGALPFGAFTAPAPVAIGESTLREPLFAGEGEGAVEVDVDMAPVARAPYPSAISTSELLERAAALGPARTTWESIVLPADPILDEKRQPHVAERRERFTRMVKIGLGACLAVCVVALGVSALSGEASASTAGTPTTAAAVLANTVPAQSIVPVEKLDGTRHAKAPRRTTPIAATAAVVRPKRR
ncbi:hypothetical protein BH11MYX4_BH11MYX4_48330 [soil metagenome]